MASSLSLRWTTDPEYINLLNFIIKRTENVESPMKIKSLARGFKEKSGAPQSVGSLVYRIERMRTWIQCSEHINTNTKVKVLFALSAEVHVYFLEEFKNNAFIEVDEKKRIIYYKSNDGSLELGGESPGDHRQSAKYRILSKNESLIRNYFENKGNADTVPKNEKKSEMENLIEFITEKCENVNSPLSINRLAKDFIQRFGVSVHLLTIFRRVKVYCREIQKLEFLDTPSKVKQLFGLSATLNSDFLKEIRNFAVVEVDHKNRITNYTANNGSLTFHGDHSRSAKRQLGWIKWEKKRKAAKKYCNFGDDDDDDYSDEDSDEYSSEKFDSDDHNNSMDEFSETKKDHEGNKNPKRKNMCSSASSEKKRNKGTTGSSALNRTRYSSNNSMRSYELDDYDTNYSIDDQVKLEPFRGSIQEDLNEIKGDEDIQQISKPLQAHDEHNELMDAPTKSEHEDQIEEVPIKKEHEEPEEVKPETSHSSKIKFFKTMQSMIVCLGTPSLSWIQSKIHQKIQKLERSDEVILNSEIALTIDLLISRMTNYSVVNLSENVESVNFSNFLCYLKAAILNSKMSGVESLVQNINELIAESQNKRIPMENVANALRATLDIDGF